LNKKVIVSVINDLVTDQRVKKVCETLESMNLEVILVGRRLSDSPRMDERSYKVHRMKLIFTKGPLFYAEFNIRLTLFLLFNKVDILVSNDLDTLLSNYLISKLKNVPLVYDTHEYFTGVPELDNRKYIKKVWKYIEGRIFPNLEDIITVNDSIAKLYEDQYGIELSVVRNIPRKPKVLIKKSREELALPSDKNIIILQGSGINIDRGAEELVEAMQHVNGTLLLIIGGGDVVDKLKDMVKNMRLSEKVKFKPRMPYKSLMDYTSVADLGVTFDKSSNINYRLSLPNKLFDYIQAGVPVLSSRLPEIEKVINKYDVGAFIKNHNPESIAKGINNILGDPDQLMKWKKNCSFAAQELTWENEEVTLKNIYSKYV
jgi:glycosyltransferase involved in cell wall biosynthesis|tara:strand:+ start:5173 stop:6291 length:1119 start_codon:yes stop_codon:yes gene_type:complete